MKRFTDYTLTPQEIKRMFGTKERYDSLLSRLAQRPTCGDYEKLKIARLLFLRGQREESWAMIESMEDEGYREDEGKQSYADWVAWEEGYLT